MADTFPDLVAGLNATIQGATGRSVTYHRALSSVTVTAVPGRTEYEAEQENGVETSTARDYIIAAEDLVLDSAAITPQRGDLIKEVIGGNVYIYEVMAIGEDCYSLDQTGTLLRVHTRQVDTE